MKIDREDKLVTAGTEDDEEDDTGREDSGAVPLEMEGENREADDEGLDSPLRLVLQREEWEEVRDRL